MAMTLRLDADQDAALERLAKAQHTSKQEAVVRAIQAELARLETASDVKAWADFALERYEGLLARLAQ